MFHWIYALVHSPRYRRRYHAMLCIDFPRIPWPSDVGTFRRTGATGEGTRGNPLRYRGGNTALSGPCADPARSGEVTVEHPRWIAPGTLLLNRELTWPEPIEEAVWQFRIGGYAVLHRWLQQRRHRTLTCEDQQHLQRMIQAIRATMRADGSDRSDYSTALMASHKRSMFAAVMPATLMRPLRTM